MTPKSTRDLRARIQRARCRTDELFSLIDDKTLYDRPVPQRHRLIFYLGHVDAFDWNQIGRNALGEGSFHQSFDCLFEFGIDPEPGTENEDRPADWPAAEEVRSYVNEVRSRVDGLLAQAPVNVVNVAIEHRLMHAETLAYLLHELDPELKSGVPDGPSAATGVLANPLVEVPIGIATLGQRADRFGWDNEFPSHTVGVPAFRVSKYKITNGEYLKFVQAGGPVPHFWTRRADEWFYRGMFGLAPLPLDCPVYATHEQASAYARSVGAALPSEEQFHRAAYGCPSGVESEYPWGDDHPRPEFGNFDFRSFDPEPVTASPAGESAFGLAQMVGNGWEWTSTEFAPFAGFEPLSFYPGYSQNFFDGKHYVLKGGSPRTAAELLRRSFRNWFRPNYPYVYAGFRVVDAH